MTTQKQRRERLSAWLRRIWIRQTDVVLAMLVTLAGLALFAFSGIGGSTHAGFVFLQNIEQRSLDLRFGMRGERAHDDRIVIVGIDEKTLQKIGSFPLPRDSYALLIKQLDAGGAGVIAFDETFPTPASNSAIAALEELRRDAGKSISPALLAKIQNIEGSSDQDASLAAALKSGGNVVLGHVFLGPGNLESTDAKVAADYYNIVWAKSFPQVVPVKGKDGRTFDLGKAWINNGGVVEAAVEPNIVKLAEAAASYGFINIRPDPDGTLRHALLIVRYQDQDFFPSLALQIVRQYENIPDQNIAAYIAEDGLERIQLGAHTLRPSRDGTALINYAGPYGTYAHYSMWDVMSGAVPPETFHNKIVLVGGTALAIGDLRNTPFEGTYMGVEVHANIIDNVLHSEEKGRGFLQRGLDEEMIDVGVILIFGIAFGVLFGRVQPLYSTLLLIVALGVFAWFVYYEFAAHGRWLSFVIPAGTLVANYAAITSFRMIFEEREKRRIRKTFSQYLSSGVISLIEKDPQKYIRPGGEMKELTVMFSDIRGFTTLSEGLTPNELVLLLNEYLGRNDRGGLRQSGHARQVYRRRDHGFLGLAVSAGRPRDSRMQMRRADDSRARETQPQMEVGRARAAGDWNWPEHRTRQCGEHGLGETTGVDGDGRQRKPCFAARGDYQDLPTLRRDRRGDLRAGGEPVHVPRTRPDRGEGQKPCSEDLRTDGHGSRTSEVRAAADAI